MLSLVTQWSEDLKQKMANNPPNPSHNADSSDEGVQAVVSDLIDRVCKAVNTQDSDVMSVDDDSSQDGSASPLPSADSPETLSQISVYLTELLDEWSLLRVSAFVLRDLYWVIKYKCGKYPQLVGCSQAVI